MKDDFQTIDSDEYLDAVAGGLGSVGRIGAGALAGLSVGGVAGVETSKSKSIHDKAGVKGAAIGAAIGGGAMGLRVAAAKKGVSLLNKVR